MSVNNLETIEVSGHLVALETVYQLGEISKVERYNLSQPHRVELAKQKHVHPFLDKLFQPSKTGWFLKMIKSLLVAVKK